MISVANVDYVTRELGYDSASAMRRIDSMRLLKELPEVETKIERGTLSLTAVARAQCFFKKEKVEIEKKRELIAAIENKPTREVDKILAQASQNPALHFREKIRPVSGELSEVRFYANDKLLQELEKLKGLLAHSHPNMSTGELIQLLAQMGLKKLDPALGKSRKKPPLTTQNESACQKSVVAQSPESAPVQKAIFASRSKIGRRPPKAVIRAVWKRDGGRCVWKNSETGQVCGSGYRIQLDHQVPWAMGGDHSFLNIRYLCFHHNQLEAEKWFGIQISND